MKILRKSEMDELGRVYTGIMHDVNTAPTAEAKRNAEIKLAGFMSACSCLELQFMPSAYRADEFYAITGGSETEIKHDIETSGFMRCYLHHLESLRNGAEYRLLNEPNLSETERYTLTHSVESLKDQIESVKRLNCDSYTRNGLVTEAQAELEKKRGW